MRLRAVAPARRVAPVVVAAVLAAGCGQGPGSTPGPPGSASPVSAASHQPGALPATPPSRTVIVMMENRSYEQVIGSPDAPFINRLAREGALLTNSHAVTHPSEPNYLALFSGSTQGVTDDSCPHRFTSPSLGSALISARLGFAGYAEDLPQAGSYTCAAGGYARKHVPWINFANVPAAASKPLGAFPAGHYLALPAVSFVIPNLCHDMHDCPVAAGDAWLRANLAGFARWAMTHRGLLVVDWDEDGDSTPTNHIPTIFVGQQVRPGRYGVPVTHYSVLRTLERLYHLPLTGQAATASTITAIWR